MYKNVLQSIDHIAVWPVISFVIFFLFFICLLWWVFSVDKKFIRKMSEMPMETLNHDITCTILDGNEMRSSIKTNDYTDSNDN